MTSAFEQIKQGPQVGITLDKLNPTERAAVERIDISQTRNAGLSGSASGRFRPVIFLPEDRNRALRLFVQENAESIMNIDYSRQNVLSSQLSRDIYDDILHVAGIRYCSKYPTVVCETRPNGEQWIIARRAYDEAPSRRYSAGNERAYLSSQQSLYDLFSSSSNCITPDELPVDGDTRQVLDYFRVSPAYPCVPTTADTGQLAIQKEAASPVILTKRELAQTYDTDSIPGPWEIVQQYNEAYRRRTSSSESDWAIAKQLSPDHTSRVYDWLARDKQPQVVETVETAIEFRYVPLYADTKQFLMLNRLVAWIFAGGSISEDRYTPRFSLDRAELLTPLIQQTFDNFEIGYSSYERTTQGRGIEIEPNTSPVLIGRILSALGAPTGEKTSHSLLHLPAYLLHTSSRIRYEFAAVYLLNRGTPSTENANTAWLSVQEERSPTYSHQLAKFFSGLTSDTHGVRRKDDIVYISTDIIKKIAEYDSTICSSLLKLV